MNFIKFIEKINFDFRLLVPVFYLLAFGYIGFSSVYNENSSIKNNKDSELVITSETKKAKKCEKSNYINQSNYTISDKQLFIDQLEGFKKIEIANRSVIIPTGLMEPTNLHGISFSPVLSKIVYIKRSAENTKVDQVIIEDLESGSKEIIYELEIGEPQGEYFKKLTGVSFSKDSKMIAITTGESMHIYELDTKEIKQIFQDENDYDGKYFGVFSYTIRIPWPIGNKVILNEGYYEGRGASIVNIQTGVKSSLDYAIYGMGEEVLDVYGDKIVVSKIVPNDQDESYYREQSEIYLADLSDSTEEYLFTVNGSVTSGTVTDNGKLYFVSRKNGSEGRYPCTRIFNANILNEYDFKTQKHIELLITDSNQGSDKKYFDFMLASFIAGKGENSDKLLLNMSWKDSPSRYLMDMDNPTELTEVHVFDEYLDSKFINKADSIKVIPNEDL